MAADEIHLGDIDTQLIVTIKDGDYVVDVSTASTLQILLRKPCSGTLLTKTAQVLTDGTDGQVYYNTIEGDLDEAGTWKLQGYVVISGGKWKSDVVSFKVHKNI